MIQKFGLHLYSARPQEFFQGIEVNLGWAYKESLRVGVWRADHSRRRRGFQKIPKINEILQFLSKVLEFLQIFFENFEICSKTFVSFLELCKIMRKIENLISIHL